MKLSCLQENLSKGLGIIGRAVATRTTLPVTNNVLLSTEESRLKLVATNLKIAITSWIGANVEEEGEITVPARLLTDFINSLPNDKVDISLNASSRSVEFRTAHSKSNINGVDAGEFPPIPTIGDGAVAKIKASDLREGINKVVFAAATEDTRLVLTGVYFLAEGSDLTMAAADGFRLAVYKTTLQEPIAEKIEIIIPAVTFAELNRLLAEPQGKEPVMEPVKSPDSHIRGSLKEKEIVEIQVAASLNQIMFRLKLEWKGLPLNVEMLSQVIPGTFPKYSQLIPVSWSTRTVISVPDFLRATKAASIFARDGSGIVKLHCISGGDIKAGSVTVSARAEEIGDHQTEFDAVSVGEEAKIAFNGKYLTDVLGVLKEGKVAEVALETSSPTSAAVLRPIGSDNYLHVIMPMFVQW